MSRFIRFIIGVVGLLLCIAPLHAADMQITLQQVLGYGDFAAVDVVGDTLAVATESGTWIHTGSDWHERLHLLGDGVTPVLSVAISPDSKLLAVGVNHYGLTQLWDLPAETLRMTLPSESGVVWTLAFNDASTILALGNTDQPGIQLWDVNTGEKIAVLGEYRYGLASLDFSGDLLAITNDAEIDLWDIPTLTKTATLTTNSIVATAFSPDGTLLATGHTDGSIRYWDMQTLTAVYAFSAHSYRIYDMAFSPDGETLVTSGTDYETWPNPQNLRIWKVKSKQRLLDFENKVRLQSLAFSDNTLIAVDFDNLYIWDTADFTQPTIIRPGHLGYLETNFSFSADGSMIVAPQAETRCATDQVWTVLKVWDTTTGEEKTCLEPHDDVWMYSLPPASLGFFSPTSPGVVWGQSSFIESWDVEQNAPQWLEDIAGFYDLNSLTISPDGKWIAYADYSNIYILDAVSHAVQKTLPSDLYSTTKMQFNADNSLLAAVNTEGRVWVWDMTTGEQIISIPDSEHYVTDADLLFDDNPSLLMMVGHEFDKLVKIIDLQTGEVVDTITGSSDAAYSPKRNLLVWGADQRIMGRDLASSQSDYVFARGDAIIGQLAFSPDDQLLAVAAGSTAGELYSCNGLRLWDVDTQTQTASVDMPSCVFELLFSPDGSLLANSDISGTIKIWKITR